MPNTDNVHSAEDIALRALKIVSDVLHKSATDVAESFGELQSIKLKYREEYEKCEEKKRGLYETVRLGHYLEDDNNWTTGPFGRNERREAYVEYMRLSALHENTMEDYLESCQKFQQATRDFMYCRISVEECHRTSAAIMELFEKPKN